MKKKQDYEIKFWKDWLESDLLKRGRPSSTDISKVYKYIQNADSNKLNY